MKDQEQVPLLLARTHTNDPGSHTNVHADWNISGHTNDHIDNSGTDYHTNQHGDHTDTSHTNIPGRDGDFTVHSDGPIWQNSAPQHGNYNWENVAHSNQHMHTNLSDSSINSDYIY